MRWIFIIYVWEFILLVATERADQGAKIREMLGLRSQAIAWEVLHSNISQ